MYPNLHYDYVSEGIIPLTLIAEVLDQHQASVQLIQDRGQAMYALINTKLEVSDRVVVAPMVATSVPCNSPEQALANCLENLRTLFVQSGHDTAFVYRDNQIIRGDDGKFWASITFHPYTRPHGRYQSPA